MKLDEIKNRIDELITKGNQLLNSQSENSDGFIRIDANVFLGLKTAALSLVLKIYDNSHPFYTEITKLNDGSYPTTGRDLLFILMSIKEEVSGGWLFTTKGLVSSEIFANFLEMAEHFLSEGYKDPAAVMIGSVLEEHLRQLCQKNDIELEIEKKDKMIPKNADRLNSDLSGDNIYSKLDQKSVTAWLDLRNKAAHGHYLEYSKEQVQLMCNGVSDFLTRNSV